MINDDRLYLLAWIKFLRKSKERFKAANSNYIELLNFFSFCLIKSLANIIITTSEDFECIASNFDELINDFCHLGYSIEKNRL